MLCPFPSHNSHLPYNSHALRGTVMKPRQSLLKETVTPPGMRITLSKVTVSQVAAFTLQKETATLSPKPDSRFASSLSHEGSKQSVSPQSLVFPAIKSESYWDKPAANLFCHAPPRRWRVIAKSYYYISNIFHLFNIPGNGHTTDPFSVSLFLWLFRDNVISELNSGPPIKNEQFYLPYSMTKLFAALHVLIMYNAAPFTDSVLATFKGELLFVCLFSFLYNSINGKGWEGRIWGDAIKLDMFLVIKLNIKSCLCKCIFFYQLRTKTCDIPSPFCLVPSGHPFRSSW